MATKKTTERRIALVIILLALCFLLVGNREEERRFNGLTPFETGWEINGEGLSMPFDIQKEEGGVYSVTNILPSSFDEKKAIVFKSENLYWKVYVDGIEIDAYQREDLKVGITPGDLWNIVILPEESAGKEIKIQMEIEFESGSNLLRTIHYAPFEVAVKEVFEQGIFGFLICMMILMLSLFYILADLFILHKQDGKYALVAWSLFSIFITLWSVSQTTLLHQLLGNGLLIRILSYATLPFVGAFVVVFLARKNTWYHSKWIKIVSAFSMLWGVIVVILDTTKKVSYTKTILITQLLIVAIMVYVSIQLINNIKNYKNKKFRDKIYIYGNLGLMLMAAWDIYSCYNLGVEDYSKNTRIALLIYTLCVGVDFFMEFIEYVKLAECSKVMKELAHSDGLTGIGNRMAFDELVDTLIRTKQKELTVVQMDVNYLKVMNDKYGHLEGDKLLKIVAQTISAVFSMGQCFRYGGDEFIVIILSKEQDLIENAIGKFIERENAMNEIEELKIPMSVAYGYAILEKDSTILDTIKKADDAMYRKKREMKKI